MGGGHRGDDEGVVAVVRARKNNYK